MDISFGILDCGFLILDFGFRISDRCSFCGSPTRSYLEFGFQIFWISGFGFGYLIWGFGLWIFDF